MDRIGRFTVILATVTASLGSSRGPAAPVVSPAPSTSPPSSHGLDDERRRGMSLRRRRGRPTVCLRRGASAGCEDRRRRRGAEPTDRRWPVDFGTAVRLPSRSPSAVGDAGGVTCRRPRRDSCRRAHRPQPLPPSAASALAPPAGPMAVQLKPAPLEPTDFGFPINLATALRLSDARPLIVAAAQASVWVAEAQLTRAKVLWVPTLMFGADYIRHDGGGPDFNKGVLTAPSVNYFYAGGGLNVSNSGLFQFVNLTDAYFEPLVARRVLNSRQWDIQTAKNDALLLTADAYFRVHQYRGMYAGALYCVERGRDLVEQIASLSERAGSEGRGRSGPEPARRPRAASGLRASSVARLRAPTSPRSSGSNPRAVVVPLEHDHLQLTLIDPAQPLPELQKIALTNRPELASQRALVQAAEARIRREKMRPLLPIVMINGFQNPGGMMTQAGIFGLGPNSSLNQWTGRDRRELQLVWQLDAFGIGNLARIKEQRGEQSQAIVELFRAQDMVAAEVTEAHARSPVGGGPGRPGRSLPARGHHRLQRQRRGPAPYHPLRRRLGPGLPAAGSGLRAEAA